MSAPGLIVRAEARWVSVLLIATHAFMAFGFLGAPRLYSSPSYTYVLVMAPAWIWGWMFIIGAAATMLAPHGNRYWSAANHVVAAIPLISLWIGFILAQTAGLAQGWGGVGLLLYPIFGHYMVVRARFHPEVQRG